MLEIKNGVLISYMHTKSDKGIVVVPEGVCRIRRNAFLNKQVRYVKLPDSLESIDDMLFENCIHLRSVEFGKNLKRIGENAFSGCSSLQEISLPDSLLKIECGAFSCCVSLEKAAFGNGMRSIGRRAFCGCGLKEAELPDSVRKIGEEAFMECGQLGSLRLPANDAAEIGRGAFAGCKELEDVVLPRGVRKIADRLFDKCGKLSGVSLVGNVAAIGDYAFRECRSLAEFHIPDSVKHIGKFAFSDCVSLRRMIIPDSVERIDEAVFCCCDALSEVRLPAGIPEITEIMFMSCTSLKEITLPPGLEMISGRAFINCSSLESVETHSAEIEMYAFADCTSLKRVVMEEGINRIEERAFYNCKSLVSAVIPGSVRVLGEGAFEGCMSLPEINLNGIRQADMFSIAHCNSITRIDIPKNIDNVSPEAFNGCKRLREINAPGMCVFFFSSSMFRDCDELEYLYAPVVDPGTWDNVDDRVTACAAVIGVFDRLSEEQRAPWREYMKHRRMDVLSRMARFGLTRAAESAVRYGFVTIRVVDDLIRIASENGHADTAAVFMERRRCFTPEQIERENDRRLTVQMRRAEAEMFKSSEIVRSWNYKRDSRKRLCLIRYHGCDATVVVPPRVDKTPVYALCRGERGFLPDSAEKLVVSSGIEVIGEECFRDQQSLREVVLPETLTTIEKAAFSGCGELSRINFPESLVSVSQNAFRRCPKLVVSVSGTRGRLFAKRLGLEWEEKNGGE